MAQLKDSIIQGNLRVSDSTLTDTLQTTTIKAPTTSGGTTYGVGSNGQVLKSNGTSTYWGDDSSGSPSTTVTAVSSSASAGTATTYSRGDHTHNISVATGDNNGQVKIAGQNASVKGLGDAAYKGVTDNSSSTEVSSTDTNLITGRTLYYAGYTKNTGTVTGSGLTADTVILGNGGTAIKTSSKTIASSGTGITDDDTKIPTSKSVKSYVDGLVANATHFKGGFAASGDGVIDGGSTTLKSVAESIGDMYTCITSGTIYGIAFEVGDSIIFKKAVAAGTAPATASGTPLASTDFITVEGETSVSVVDNNPTLSWSTQSKVATIEGTEINVTMPANPNTDTSVTSSDNHYTPSTVSGEDKTASASGATAAWSIDVVKGVTLNTDGKGHVTGLSVTSGKIPSNPNTNTIPSAYCTTAATTAAKTASCTNYALLANSWLHVLISNSNTSANALTLSVNSKTAKPIYINGSASSSTNYTLPAGTYLVYYDGTNYYFRTDGKLTADITGNASTATKLGTSNKGSSTKPIYLSGGVPTECDSYPTSLPASNTTNTYSSTGTAPVSGTAVAAALGTLDGNLNNTTPSSGKTLTAFSQTDGIVSATFGDISITKSQVSDFPSTMTPSSHTHGNIQNGGTLQTTDVAIASGDKLVVTDSSDSNKIARTSVSFDGSTATKCLTQKGTWEPFTNNAGTVTSVTLKANSPISVDSTAAITGSGTRTFSHANSGVSAGTYKSVTVNATGHVTGGSNPTTLSGYGITDAYTKTETDDLIEVLPSLVDESKKNLYKLYYSKTSTNTLEYTVNSDNTVTVTSGYGSLICSAPISNYITGVIPSSQGLVFSGCPAGGSETTYHSYLYVNENNRYVELGDGVLKNLETGTQYQTMPIAGTITWTLHVINGNTTYPLIFKPMVCSLEDWKVSQSYVPYCDSNYELTKRVGVSDNALDAIAMDGSKNKLQNNATSTGIFTVNSDGTVTATVPASNTQTSLTLFTADSDISFDHDMVLSGCPADGSYVYRYAIYLLDANGNIVMIGSDGMADEGITRVIPAGTSFRSVRILIRANIGSKTLTFKPMLCDKDLYALSPEYIPYAPTNRELYEADKELDQIKFTPETSAPTSSQRLLFTSPKSNNNLTMLVGKLDSSTNYVQFYVNGVDKGYIKFDVSRNINTWQ